MADEPDYRRAPQPRHEEGAVSAHDLAADDVRAAWLPEYACHGTALLAERRAYGLRKYGTILHAANGRDYAQDTLDELGDLVPYLRAWMLAQPDLAPALDPVYRQAVHMLVTVTHIRAHGYPPPVGAHLERP